MLTDKTAFSFFHWVLFFGILMGIGCTPETRTQPDTTTKPETAINFRYPRLEEYRDTLVFVDSVRRYVAKHADTGLLPNAFCDTFNRVPINRFRVDEYLSIFEQNRGTATCSLAAQIMVKMLLQNGLDAYTYNFGFNNTRLSHVIVLVKFRKKLLVFDPYMNYALLNSAGKNMGLTTLLQQIAGDSLNMQFSADTVETDMLIDHRILNGPHRERLNSAACEHWRLRSELLRDSIYRYKVIRCFSCEADEPCHSFVRDFEKELSEKTRFNTFHQGFALKINQVYGAKDDVQVNARIDSLIMELGLSNLN